MGNNSGNTIEINGKRYDAVTGQFLGVSTPGESAGKKVVNIEGIRRQPRSMDIAVRPKAAHAPAAHIAAHHPQKGKTLLRAAVKKPAIVAPSKLKAQTRTDVLARVPEHTLAPKLSHAAIDPKRLKHASFASKSPAVSKYAAKSQLPSSSQTYYDLQAAREHSAAALVAARNRTGQPGSRPPHIPVRSTDRHARKGDVFENAIANATSHENTYDDAKPMKRNRLAGVATFTMAFLLLAGIVGYMNLPMLSMKVAASRAGVDAKLPGYSPAGFSYGSLSYGPGNVTVSYTAGEQSDRQFDITQKVSEWDSQALLTNFVASANKAYQTYERAGRTIYFYGDNTATWVDGGIWYTVNGNNSLSKNQLLDMAGSL